MNFEPSIILTKLRNYRLNCLRVPVHYLRKIRRGSSYGNECCDGVLNRHSITINGKNDNISRKDLEAVAQRNDIRDNKYLIDMVLSAANKFKDYAKELNIGQPLIESITILLTRP